MFFTEQELEKIYVDTEKDDYQEEEIRKIGYTAMYYRVPLLGLSKIGERIFGISLLGFEDGWIDAEAHIRRYGNLIRGTSEWRCDEITLSFTANTGNAKDSRDVTLVFTSRVEAAKVFEKMYEHSDDAFRKTFSVR